jgi:hypothetical protein
VLEKDLSHQRPQPPARAARPGRPAASDRTSRAAMCAQPPSRGRHPSTTATSDAACQRSRQSAQFTRQYLQANGRCSPQLQHPPSS